MSVTRLAVISSALCVACLTSALGQEGRERYFNVKAGPVYVTLSSGVITEYTDNVNLSNGKLTPIQSELTINPNFGITAATELDLKATTDTNRTSLSLSANLGYKDYVFHPELSQKTMAVNIAPDSELALVIHAGHFKIRVHDGFSIQSDPATDGSLSNVTEFRRFLNSAGVSTDWDVNSKTQLNLSYIHTNLYSLGITSLGNSGTVNNLSSSNLNNSTDSLNFSGGCQVLSLLKVGFSSMAQATTYPGAPQQESTSYSYGPTASLRLTQYSSLSAACGISESRPGNAFTGTGAAGNGPATSTTEYYDLTLNNQTNTHYTQTFSVGRQLGLTLLGSQTEDKYARYTSSWRVNSHITLNTSIFTDDTTNLGIIGGAFHYRLYGCSLSTGYQLSKKMNTTLSYRYIDKIADDSAQNYKQNTITWSVNYQF